VAKQETHESVKNRQLKDLCPKESYGDTKGEYDELIAETALMLIDTAGCSMYESTNAAGSRYNEEEAQLVEQHMRKLLAIGLTPNQIAIITPYNGQVELLRQKLLPDTPGLQIRSVDGFQGGEREAVILSLVRSSARGGQDGIGFLRDDRRLNVAVTRAKRHCCVICDTETVSKSEFVHTLVTWIAFMVYNVQLLN
jgi:ATP-dependent RNA/DNA helicase IGHMBP2